MRREYRIVSNESSLNPLQDFSGIVLGDEGCIYKAMDEGWMETADKALKNGLAVRYLTPVVPECYVDKLYQRIKIMSAEAIIKVTFNDYGLLSLCRPLIERGQIIPVLGRILSRSVCECPWHKELLKYEEPELAAVVAANTLKHQAKIDIFNTYNIQEFELNQQEVSELKKYGFDNIKLTTYQSNRIIAVGRICYSARWYEMVLPECIKDRRCSNKLYIKLDKMWGKKRLMYEEPPEYMKGYYNKLYVTGNIVYEELGAEENLNLLRGFDTVIL